MEKKLSRSEQAKQTKKHILETAMRLFEEEGYEKVTIRKISSTAGVSIGNFYHYFKSKEDIQLQMYRNFDEMVRDVLKKKEYTTKFDAIRDLIVHQLELDPKRVEIMAQTLRVQLASEKYVIDENREITSYLENLLNEARDAGEIHPSHDLKETRDWILRTSRGILFDWSLRGGTYDMQKIALHDINVILDFLSKDRK